jgi:hypothetical protein
MATTLIDVPLSGQTLGQTRVPIRTNFTVISDAFQIDHVAYNAAGQGKHKWITFPVQVQATAQAALTYPDIGLYSSLYATTGINELFFRNSGNVVPDVPFTASAYAPNGFAYLPSGILLKWGTSGVNDNSTNNIPLNAAGTPLFTSILSIQVSLLSNQTVYPGTATNMETAYPYNPAISVPVQTFRVRTVAINGARSISWFAIGF